MNLVNHISSCSFSEEGNPPANNSEGFKYFRQKPRIFPSLINLVQLLSKLFYYYKL